MAVNPLSGFTHRRRRGAELFLIVLSLLVGIGAYAAVGLGVEGTIPANIVGYGAWLAVLVVACHIVVRMTAPYADPVLLPVVAALNGLGLAMIYRIDLAELSPPPAKLVANLPYNVATPLVAETLTRVSPLGSWCVMVQREVADRFFAEPGTKAYGAVSVLVRLHARRTGFHPISRTVFRPPPNVDSALVAFERIEPPADPGVLAVVSAAFGHRRKTLANALALSGVASRERAVEALASIGRRGDVRAEALEPQEFVLLAGALGR